MSQIANIMTKNVVTISQSDKVIKAVKIMTKKRIGGVVVLNNKKPVGMVTESDLVRKVLSKNINPGKINVSDILTRRLVFITPNSTFYNATKLMVKNKIKRLPVISNSKLIGIVTTVDLVKQCANYTKEANLKAIVNYWFKKEEAREKFESSTR